MARSDSKLKTLPEAIQADMWRMRSTPVGEDGAPVDPSEGSAMSQGEVLAWLEEKHSVKSSLAAFSEWERWYRLASRFKGAKDYAKDARELLKDTNPELSIRQLDAYGDLAFRKMAFDLDDFAMFAEMRKITQKDQVREQVEQKLEMEDRRIKILEMRAKRDEAAEAVASNGDLTDEERGQELRNLFGMG